LHHPARVEHQLNNGQIVVHGGGLSAVGGNG
jgi:hypothetical protein